jgi:hypothetical protein
VLTRVGEADPACSCAVGCRVTEAQVRELLDAAR